MSVNRYDASTGELTNIASGQRTWVGTQAAYKTAKQAGTLPNNAIIAITDDEVDHNHYSTEETKTGMYWIDGKPIYRKVLICTTTTRITASGDWQIVPGWSIDLSDLNIDRITSTTYAQAQGYSNRTDESFNENILKFYSLLSYYNVLVGDALIIEYTKSTD